MSFSTNQFLARNRRHRKKPRLCANCGGCYTTNPNGVCDWCIDKLTKEETK